jgi:outer membrane lipopolysaccharide assembly protein LptE/RlpB
MWQLCSPANVNLTAGSGYHFRNSMLPTAHQNKGWESEVKCTQSEPIIRDDELIAVRMPVLEWRHIM